VTTNELNQDRSTYRLLAALAATLLFGAIVTLSLAGDSVWLAALLAAYVATAATMGFLWLRVRAGSRLQAAFNAYAEKTELEEEVRRRPEVKEQLVAAARRKNAFLAMLAHELRNPLAPLSNCLELLRQTGNEPSVLAQACPIMERQVRQMSRLVDDLLDVARLDRNRLKLRKQRVCVAEVIQQAVETSRPLIEARAHRLTITLPLVPIELEADPVRLTQVLSNLLNNAAKYTDVGGRIQASVALEGPEVVFMVRDTGIGIPGNMLTKIFAMYTQLEQASGRAQGGLGIGLALVRWLVKLHGGTVEARSDGVGRGSEFLVRLPGLSCGAPERRPPVIVSNGPKALRDQRIPIVRHRVNPAQDTPLAPKTHRRPRGAATA
jgi:signal transduction histidine kinase